MLLVNVKARAGKGKVERGKGGKENRKAGDRKEGGGYVFY